jgi:Glycosyl transferase family 2
VNEPQIVVFIPVYHGVMPMLNDLLDSVDAYLGCAYHIIIVDDCTTDGTWEALQTLQCERGTSQVTLLRNDSNQGWGFGIYKNFARAALHALEQLEFDVFLKLDHDSLLIAPNVGAGFRSILEVDGVGITGTLQPEVNKWMFDWRTNPQVKREAVQNGYFGMLHGLHWSVQAGAMGFTRGVLRALKDREWLERFDFVRFGTAGLVEDVMLPILAAACGFTALNAPFVLSTHGSPALLRLPYTQMRGAGLRVIHPVKHGFSSAAQHNSSDHADMRGYFQRLRATDRA